MTQQPIPWFDQALDTRERKILTYDRHGIPGLRMIGCHNTSHATAPLPPHYHRDCFEFTYVVQGNLTFHVDHRRYDLSGGDLFLTFPDEIHDTGNAPMSLHRMYWFQLDVRCPEGMLGLEGAFARKLIAALSGLDCRVVRMDPAAEGLFKAAFADLYGGDPLGHLRGSALLTAILCQILHDAALPGSRVSPDIARAAAYVRSHIHERIAIEDLASEASLSVSRFKEKFKAQMGTGPRNYINYHKIQQAKALLDQGWNVTDTAMALGFSGSDYFSVVFRRYTLLSPTEYQRRSRCTGEDVPR